MTTTKKLSPRGMLLKGGIYTYIAPRLAQDAKIDIDAILDNASGHLDSCRRYVNGKGECDCILADLAKLIGQKQIGAKP